MEQTKNYESPEVTVVEILGTEQAFAGSTGLQRSVGINALSIEEEEW